MFVKNILVLLGSLALVHSGAIDVNDGLYVASWNLDGLLLYVAITARTTGYIGFGIGPHPNMTNADIFISGVDDNGKDYAFDMHGIGNGMPEFDIKNDYELLETSQNATHTFVTFLRKLNTEDSQDVVVANQEQNILWSVGLNDTLMHHMARGVLKLNLQAS